MVTLVELAAQLVAVRAKQGKISTEEIVAEIAKVHAAPEETGTGEQGRIAGLQSRTISLFRGAIL